MKVPPNAPCACHSGQKYKRCCRPYHRGAQVEQPELLMRARYAAFSYGLAAYVMQTTHPSSPSIEADPAAWERSILEFARDTRFAGLEVEAASGSKIEASVTFRAMLWQGERDVSFTERSRFLREGDRWLYHSGVVS